MSYDLLFIELLSSLEVAVSLRMICPNAAIVLLAHSPALAVEGYRAGAMRYLLMPVSADALTDVYHALHQVYLYRRLAVHTAGEIILLPHTDILYLQTLGRTAETVLSDRTIVCTETLSDLLARLPPETFLRTHQSYAINLEKLQVLDKNSVTLVSGHMVPVSRRLHAGIKERIERDYMVLG